MRTTPRAGGLAPPLVIGALGVLVISGLLDGIWMCPAKRLFGVPCPGCGMTRAVRMLLHGDVAGATAMQPLVWPLLALGVAFAVLEVRGHLRGRPWGASMEALAPRIAFGVFVAALFGVWVARFAGHFGGPVP